MLVSELVDVFLLAALGRHVLLPELLSVAVEAVMHGSGQRFSGDRLTAQRDVILLYRRDVFAYPVDIIHLFVFDVKRFYQKTPHPVKSAEKRYYTSIIYIVIKNTKTAFRKADKIKEFIRDISFPFTISSLRPDILFCNFRLVTIHIGS